MELAWNDPCLDRIRWMLGHLETLKLSSDQALILLLIEYMNGAGIDVTHESLAEKSGLDVEKIEDIFSRLSELGYLKVDFSDGIVRFLLDGVAGVMPEKGQVLGRSLIEEFEMEFGRSLSSMEMQRILELAQKYDERRVIVALNESASYDRRDLNYIENCLVSWMNKGYSIEDVENGKR